MGKIIALLSVTLFMITGCDIYDLDRSLEVHNGSNYDIVVRLITKNAEEVGWRHFIKAHSSEELMQKSGDFWRTAVEEENGLIMQAFSCEDLCDKSRGVNQNKPLNMMPLKEWDIPDWEYVESVGGKFYYP